MPARPPQAPWFALLATLSLLAASPARAAWIADGTPICNLATNQVNPDIAPDGAGGAFFVWADPRTGTTDIYVQHLNAAGDLPAGWPANGLAVCTAASTQNHPVAIADGFGGVIVAWEDTRNANFDVYAQRVSAGGAMLWLANGVPVTRATRGQTVPRLASDGAGGAIVAWMDERPATTTYDVYARRVNAAGDTLWTGNGVAVCTASGNQITPQLVGDGAGGAIVAWIDLRLGDNAAARLYAQRLSSAGAVAWAANGSLVSSTDVFTSHPIDLAPRGSDGAYVAWTSFTTRESRLQRLLGDGSVAPGWTAAGIVPAGSGGDDARPRVLPDGSGGCVVSTSGIPLSCAFGFVSVARVDETGAGLWAQYFYADFPQHGMAADGTGGALVAYQDFRGCAPTSDLYFGRATGFGNIPGDCTDQGGAFSLAANSQLAPLLVSDGTGGALVVWTDNRTSGTTGSDIYAAHIACGGTSGVDGGGPAHGVAQLRVSPNPSTRAITVDFALRAGENATLRLLDVAGRTHAVRELPAGSGGPQRLVLGEAGALPAGIYFVRLVQGPDVRFTRAAIVR